MKRAFTQTFLAGGVLLILTRGVPAYATNMAQDVDLPIGARGNQVVLETASIPATSSTASVNKASMDSDSTATGNATSTFNAGAVNNATDGTTNHGATFSGGNPGIGTTNPAAGAKVELRGPVKAAGTGNKACKASDVGAMRYNATGNYLEICSYP